MEEITSILQLDDNLNIQILPESEVIIHLKKSNVSKIVFNFVNPDFNKPYCTLEMNIIGSCNLEYLETSDISWKLYIGDKIKENKEAINNLFLKYGKKIWDKDYKKIPFSSPSKESLDELNRHIKVC